MKSASDGPAGPELLWRRHHLKVAPGVAVGKGRGLFAVEAIGAGEIIDRAVTAPIERDQCLVLDTLRPVGDFYFAHPDDEKRGLMVFGLASLLNHADDPNADVRFRAVAGFGHVAELLALENIHKGAEITYRYKCPLWFDRAD